MELRKPTALIFLLFSSIVFAETCAVYFTGVGCPHCSKADPVVLEEFTASYPDLVIIEYEIYRKQANAPLFYDYDGIYGSGYGVPALVFGPQESIVGDNLILNNAPAAITSRPDNPCPLLSGLKSFEEIDFSRVAGDPVVWANGRAFLGKPADEESSDLLKELLFAESVLKTLKEGDYSTIESIPLALSGKEVEFDNAVVIGGAVFEWNGAGVAGEANGTGVFPVGGGDAQPIELTWPKILGLAAVDAVNPCAFAVLTLMLLAIITYNPEDKRNLLLAGLAFVASVFVMYLVYGLVIIKFFQLIQALTAIRLVLYKALGFVAIILGLLNLRDFFHYRPGGFATEMPLSMRGPLKKLISGVTSPRGAFVVGAFVTVFLLPCTIGPYVIAGGILSAMELVKTIPWLLLYNAVFVLPMLFLTGVVYFGAASVENLSDWKDNNIRYMHLIAGAIILVLGLAMVAGLV